MDVRFNQIFDFQFRQAVKLENSYYLEDFTGLLERVASNIDDESNYYWGKDFYVEDIEQEPNCSYNDFIKSFKNSFEYGSYRKINVVRGRAGIGKSLFFKTGIKKLLKNFNDSNDNYINLVVDFRNIDNDEKIQFYTKWIYAELEKLAIDCIRILGNETYRKFEGAHVEFGNKYKTPHTDFFPLKYFCEEIYKKYHKPCVIVFDNIDLASITTQENVFNATVNICNIFSDFMKIYCPWDCYRVYFVMRPETELRYNEGRVGEAINFPLPNILNIMLATMNKALMKAAEEFDNERKLPCRVICADVISSEEKYLLLESYTAVAKYFYKILDYYLRDLWDSNSQTVERLGKSEEFHCNIANYNVRTFLKFLADTISNGGFKPFTKEFNQKQGFKYYNIYDYIEMLIRGRWFVHPGNKHVNGEGGNKAPIVFNLFDTSLYGNREKDKVRHFMLNIRILQYFFLYSENFVVCYEDMEQSLSNFFDVEYIEKATKKLIHIHFLYSYKDGDSGISYRSSWKDVQIIKDAKYNLSPSGRFYLEKFGYEFEYLFQMGLSSLMCDSYVAEMKLCWKTEKELIVFCFLKSIFEIIKINISEYDPEKLRVFKELFYDIDQMPGSQPFRRMVKGFISVMNNKVQRAENKDTDSIGKLKAMLNEAIVFESEVKCYFDTIFE